MWPDRYVDKYFLSAEPMKRTRRVLNEMRVGVFCTHDHKPFVLLDGIGVSLCKEYSRSDVFLSAYVGDASLEIEMRLF